MSVEALPADTASPVRSGRAGDDDIITAWSGQASQQSASYNNTDNMGDSDMSPKARVTYDQHKFQVEFNVSEYLPEVREALSFVTTCKKSD